MAKLHNFNTGGYAFLEGGFPYSQAVIALSGFSFRRIRFGSVVPVEQGFEWIRKHLQQINRPLTALAACELRSPCAFTMDGFRGFNQRYVKVLSDWGLIQNGLNPVARSNLAPAFSPPKVPGFYAFTYTVPETCTDSDWLIAGSGEWPEHLTFPEGIVARGDISPKGMERKVRYVVQTMQERAQGLQAQWSRLTAAQIYTVHDFSALIPSVFNSAGMLGPGLSWHICNPPIQELEFEMDARSVQHERVVHI
jgi:hypothetical protein